MGFFGDLFGGKSQQRAANQAAEASAAYTNTGYTKQRDELGRGYGSADTILQGYEKPGQQAYGQYADAIGVNGADGYGRAKQSFDADPFRTGQTDATNRAIQSMFRRYNPTGQTGQQMAAVGRVGSDIYGQQVEGFRSRLAGLGQQGAQFGTARAGNAINQGQEMGQSYLGQNNQLGSIENNRIQGVQAAKAQGQSNIMKTVGGAAQLAMMGFAPVPGAGDATAFGNIAKMFSGGNGQPTPSGGQNALMSGYAPQGAGYVPSYNGGSYNTGYSKNFGWGA
jgi:hypothetical protein